VFQLHTMDSHMCEDGFVVINNCSMNNNNTNTGKDFNIVDEYGAVGDGETVNTAMIQAAILMTHKSTSVQ